MLNMDVIAVGDFGRVCEIMSKETYVVVYVYMYICIYIYKYIYIYVGSSLCLFVH